MTVFAHSHSTNKLVNEAANDSAQGERIVKYRPLSEPIRSQDLEDSARSQAWKKKIKNNNNNNYIIIISWLVF